MENITLRTIPFNKDSSELISFKLSEEDKNLSINWPTVYILYNENEAYIGETYKVKERFKQHWENEERRKLKEACIIIDGESNKSVTLDLESFLIRYISSDGLFKLQNSNRGLLNYDYYNREKYRIKFEKIIWPKLKKLGLAKRELKWIQNDDLFKYSPYTPLAANQNEILNKILNELVNSFNRNVSILVNGGAGTGKTVLGSYLMKLLISEEDSFEEDEIKMDLARIKTKISKIGFIIPQQSLRKTLKRAFNKISGLNSAMVLSPNDVAKAKDKYDLLIVDEAHRLRRRKNLSNYKDFDENNRKLGLDKDSTELDWILKKSKYQIFFYDVNQSIKPTDIGHDYFLKQIKNSSLFFEHILVSQFRVKGGDNYISYIKNILESYPCKRKVFSEYDFRNFNNFEDLVNEITLKEQEFKLSRLVAGYGWKWISKKDSNLFDIEIESKKFKWNTESLDWINSKNSITEIGCIHTIQGYDLNYIGVIFGPEIDYDFEKNKIKILKENYHDFNGKRSVTDKELESYIKNIYGVLLTRGMRGTYTYAVNDNMKKYLAGLIHTV